MHLKIASVWIIFFIVIQIISCGGGKMDEKDIHYDKIKEIPVSAWEKLSNKKIYFAHMSVGYNIIDGIKDLMKAYPRIKLNIIETTDPAEFENGIFAHAKVGENTNPKSKMDDFEKILREGLGDNVDIALLKFCYVDFDANSDIEKVFNEYKRLVSKLEKAYPKVDFIHTTVPLTTLQTGIKAWVKKILGKSVWGAEENIKRIEFAERIKKEFDTVFDLAKVESTWPNHTREFFSKDGKTYYAMVPEYTYDSGHLNEMGRKKAAEDLLLLLVNLK